MKYGSIDLCVRALSVWPRGEQVGYHGVLDLFSAIRCAKAFEHYWPRTRYFLSADNFAKWVGPHLQPSDGDRSVMRQRVANSILAKMSELPDSFHVVAGILRQCREVLHAEPTVQGGLARKIHGMTVWQGLFGVFGDHDRPALHVLRAMLCYGPKISATARACTTEAEVLRACWDNVGGLDEDWQTFVERCENMTAFTSSGMDVLRA